MAIRAILILNKMLMLLLNFLQEKHFFSYENIYTKETFFHSIQIFHSLIKETCFHNGSFLLDRGPDHPLQTSNFHHKTAHGLKIENRFVYI